MAFVSALDVARLAGVSRSAVSRCFTPGASIAPETRAKVEAAAATLGYQVNELARSLIAQKSRIIGLMGRRSEIGFRPHLVAALGRALIARGSIPVLLEIGSTEAEIRAAQEMLIGHRAEAIVVLSGSAPQILVEAARRNGQALILVARDEPDCDQIRTDNGQAAREAFAVLAALPKTQLALIGSLSATPSLVERENAFRAAADKLGRAVDWRRGIDSSHEGGYDAMQAICADHKGPLALFCVNDLMSFGAIDAARAAGRVVGQDTFIIGFDDLPEAAWPAWDLTTFRQDPQALAEAVIELIDRRSALPNAAPMALTLNAPLMRRGSCP